MVYLLRADMVYESFVPDKHYRDLRSLSKDRIGMAGAGAGQKNRITATMAKYDYRSPTKSKFGKKGPARRAARTCRRSAGCRPARTPHDEAAAGHRDARNAG